MQYIISNVEVSYEGFEEVLHRTLILECVRVVFLCKLQHIGVGYDDVLKEVKGLRVQEYLHAPDVVHL